MKRSIYLLVSIFLMTAGLLTTEISHAASACQPCNHKNALCSNCDAAAKRANALCDILNDEYDAHEQAKAKYRVQKQIHGPGTPQSREAASNVDRTRKSCKAAAAADFEAAKKALDECEKTRCGYDGSNIEDSIQIPPRYYKTCFPCQHLADQLANIDRNIDEQEANIKKLTEDLRQTLDREKRQKIYREIRRRQNRINKWLAKRKKIQQALEDCIGERCQYYFDHHYPKSRKAAKKDHKIYLPRPEGYFENPWRSGFYLAISGATSNKSFSISDHNHPASFNGNGYITVVARRLPRSIPSLLNWHAAGS